MESFSLIRKLLKGTLHKGMSLHNLYLPQSLDNDAIARYVSRRDQDLNACMNALRNENYELLKETAHKVIGNSVSFGFPELSELAVRLQNAAETKDQVLCAKTLNEFRRWVSSKKAS